MTNTLSRRDFMKIGAGTAVATGLGAAARKVALEPFVRPPEDLLPGQATWYASTCRQCAAGCGILVRVINGRAKKIEGNPLHPLNRGKLCARGQAGLQVLYNPDRLRNAVRQSGGRGSRVFEPLYWNDALDQLAEKLSGLSDPGRVAFLAGLMPDHLYRVVSLFLEALGSAPPIVFDLHSALEGRMTADRLSRAFFNASELPVYDLARTQVVLSFGANFLETWMSPVAQGRDYGRLREGRFGGRGLLVQFEPRLSATGASADEWIPVRPGTEGHVALALGRIMVEERLGHVGSLRRFAGLYENVEVGAMAEASQVPVKTLRRLANVFADADQAVAVPGGYLAGHRNGLASMRAVQTLNVLSAQIGRQGGVFLSHPAPAKALSRTARVDPFDRVGDLISRMRAGDVDLLFIHGTNPIFELPAAAGFAEALSHVPFVVSFNSFVDETGVQADLLLPDHSYLEAWGYQIPSPGADRPVVTSQQPVVQPLYDTRATADVILALASRLGGAAAQALPWPDEVAMLEASLQELVGSSLSAFPSDTAQDFWAVWRQSGGWWSEKEIPREPVVADAVTSPLPVVEPVLEGDVDTYPFMLYPYPTVSLGDGRGAHLPWLQETPDPLTTVSWGTWVELHPDTARALGVADDDIVRVTSPFGSLEAPVVVYRAIRPDVVAIPIGQGHVDYGRFARGRGANPMALVAPVTDPDSGALAWAATRVRVEATGRRRALARLESLEGAGRETLR